MSHAISSKLIRKRHQCWLTLFKVVHQLLGGVQIFASHAGFAVKINHKRAGDDNQRHQLNENLIAQGGNFRIRIRVHNFQ